MSYFYIHLQNKLNGLDIPKTNTEHLLLLRLAGSDTNAFDELYEMWYDKVYGTALLVCKSPELARDIAQEIFLLLWRDREKMVHINNLGSYLFVSTRNMILNKVKRQTVESAYLSYLKIYGSEDDTQIYIPESLRIRELKRVLEEGVSKLPPQQQKAFRLSREQGLTHEQIAQIMNISSRSVKDYIVKALAFLHNYLSAKGELLALIIGSFLSQ